MIFNTNLLQFFFNRRLFLFVMECRFSITIKKVMKIECSKEFISFTISLLVDIRKTQRSCFRLFKKEKRIHNSKAYLMKIKKIISAISWSFFSSVIGPNQFFGLSGFS